MELTFGRQSGFGGWDYKRCKNVGSLVSYKARGILRVIIHFPLAFVQSARLRGLLTKEIENGREERISTGCNVATIEGY